MAMEPITRAIKEGVANGRTQPADYGVTLNGEPINHSPSSHPNRTVLMPAMKQFSMVRQTMNKSLGDNGLITISVQAVDGPAACRLISEEVDRINEPFIRRERKNTKMHD